VRLGIDYDGTWTADPGLFRRIWDAATARGHEVVIVTGRAPDHPVLQEERFRNLMPATLEVIHTDGAPKGEFMRRHGRPVDIWVDDRPEFINPGAALQMGPDQDL